MGTKLESNGMLTIELARVLGASRSGVNAWVQAGLITAAPPVKIAGLRGPGAQIVSAAEVERVMNAARMAKLIDIPFAAMLRLARVMPLPELPAAPEPYAVSA